MRKVSPLNPIAVKRLAQPLDVEAGAKQREQASDEHESAPGGQQERIECRLSALVRLHRVNGITWIKIRPGLGHCASAYAAKLPSTSARSSVVRSAARGVKMRHNRLAVMGSSGFW
jgi:hypothetical protein